jgi:hypothetical protein
MNPDPEAQSYSTRALAHRPRTRDEIRVAIHEMRARGLGDHEIAQATGHAVEQVRRLIGERRE